MLLTEGHTYEITYPDGNVTVATLDKIQTYPASGMPPDYIFRYISGHIDLRDSAAKNCPTVEVDQFPIPHFLIPLSKYKDLTAKTETKPPKKAKKSRGKRLDEYTRLSIDSYVRDEGGYYSVHLHEEVTANVKNRSAMLGSQPSLHLDYVHKKSDALFVRRIFDKITKEQPLIDLDKDGGGLRPLVSNLIWEFYDEDLKEALKKSKRLQHLFDVSETVSRFIWDEMIASNVRYLPKSSIKEEEGEHSTNICRRCRGKLGKALNENLIETEGPTNNCILCNTQIRGWPSFNDRYFKQTMISRPVFLNEKGETRQLVNHYLDVVLDRLSIPEIVKRVHNGEKEADLYASVNLDSRLPDVLKYARAFLKRNKFRYLGSIQERISANGQKRFLLSVAK